MKQTEGLLTLFLYNTDKPDLTNVTEYDYIEWIRIYKKIGEKYSLKNVLFFIMSSFQKGLIGQITITTCRNSVRTKKLEWPITTGQNSKGYFQITRSLKMVPKGKAR